MSKIKEIQKVEGFKTLSVEDNVKKYSHDISDNDIKAFVWYNQTIGVPMYGWEKWFMKSVKSLDERVKAKENVEYLNQQFKVIGAFQAGDFVGKITRFRHKYNGTDYVVCRKSDGQLVIVDESKITIQKSTPSLTISELTPLVKSFSLYYINGDVVPLHVYSNTDYEILRTQLELDKEFILNNFGIEVYDNAKCIIEFGMDCNKKTEFDATEKLKAEKDTDYIAKTIRSRFMRVDSPLFQERYKLGWHSEIAREVKTEVQDEDDEQSRVVSVSDAFVEWIDSLKNSEFKLVSKSQFRSIIIHDYKERFAKSDEEGKERYKNVESNAQLEAVRLFSTFCADHLPTDTKVKLNRIINLTYNRSILINTSKVPVGFVCSSLFGLNPFRLKPVQVEAFKFAVSRNNWCLALTVGFGKTSLCISLLSYFVSSGAINKPLIIVPKPVLSNWIKEMNGYWIETGTNKVSLVEKKGFDRRYGILSECGFDIINLKNLDKKQMAFARQVKSKSKCLTICTYEALKNMCIGSEDVRHFVINEWKTILTGEREESARDWSAKLLALENKLNSVDKNAEIDIQELGFDSMFVDEAHRLKNMFTSVTADKTNRVRSSFSGNNSSRALRGFYISMYIQKNGGRIGFLTATPFSNTPLEVYTMLCFLGYGELTKNNINTITKFVELFFNETVEPVVSTDNKIKYQAVMKNYKNKPILNTLLSNTFLYKDDPSEAGIERPCIIRYPQNDAKIMLKMSDVQKMQRDLLIGDTQGIMDLMQSSTDENLKVYAQELLDKYRSNILSLKAHSQGGSIVASSKISALSPFAGSPVSLSFITDERWSELYYNSPKIRFTCDAIYSIMQYHKDREETPSSVLIYCEVGLNILPIFKEALENVCGFKKRISIKEDEDNEREIFDEVEIIEGTASNDKEQNRRDAICKMFNMGKVKVVIGTSTIKEGINLQENCATLFILTPSWNSTDINQVEGRIHRQGNRFGYARVVTPVVSRTMDSFIYEKYDQKKSRLADIWKNDGQGDTEDLTIEISAEKQKELILDSAIEIAKIRADMDILKKVNIFNKSKEDYEAVRNAILNSGHYNELLSFHLDKTAAMLKTANTNLSLIKSLKEHIEKDKAKELQIKTWVKNLANDRLPNLISYYTDLIALINIANTTKKPSDLVNILNTNYKQRTYSISSNYDVKIETIEYMMSKGFSRTELENLWNDDIFRIVDVVTKQGQDTEFWEAHKDSSFVRLKEVYSSTALAEKYILNPEGLSLTSKIEDLNNLVETYKIKLDMIDSDLNASFDMVDSGKQKYIAKPEYIEKLKNEAQIQLDEENSLARMSEELGFWFADLTNVQLSYLKNDVDLKKCALKTSNNNDTNEKKIDVETVIVEDAEVISSSKQKSEKINLPSFKLITKNIKDFVPPQQLQTIGNLMRGEEKDYFKQMLIDLDDIISNMPKTYQTEGIEEGDKIAYLHYFMGGSDWYILEKDTEKEQLQAFGYVILNQDYQNAEYGYIDIQEIKSIRGMEIDTHFTPKKLVVELAKQGHPEYFEYLNEATEIDTEVEIGISTPAEPTPAEPSKPSNVVLKMRLKAIEKLMKEQPNSVVLKMRIKAVNKLMSSGAEKMENGGNLKWDTGAGVNVYSFLVGDEVYTNGNHKPLGMVTSIGSKNVMVKRHKDNKIVPMNPTKLWVSKNIPYKSSFENVSIEVDALYLKSGFINTDFNWRLKLLEMLQDKSIEAYNIYQSLSKSQKDQVLQDLYESDNDMGAYGDGDIETTKGNLEILLEDAKNGKIY